MSANSNTERDWCARLLAEVETVKSHIWTDSVEMYLLADDTKTVYTALGWANDIPLLARALRLASEQIAALHVEAGLARHGEITPESVQAGLLREAAKP